MPIGRVAGCSTRAGRLIIGPAGRPVSNPSTMTVEITAPLCDSASIRAANTMQLATTMDCGRLVRSARNPPDGTEITPSHNTMLMADPAAAIDLPRSTSIEGPKLKITAKPTLYRPQLRPAAITAIRALRSSRADVATAVTAFAGGWYAAAKRTRAIPISAATARYTAPTP